MLIISIEHLFSRIPLKKVREWRTMFSSEEAKKLKEEEAAMKARKKARKKAERAPKTKGLSRGHEYHAWGIELG